MEKDFSIIVNMLLYGKYDGTIPPAETTLRTKLRKVVVDNGEFALPVNEFKTVDGKVVVPELEPIEFEPDGDD